ncbi:DUF6069 family protein [Streptomyces sp. YIM 98790]|uniref:DUF6069 family protein n=1 Tax=Streptomyces sp. YIM 98790 TaxID=2689077 RepID=UPI00140E7473|nr:DUF6069 family protein [Streptomyces sp. YIM 98790]
MSQPQPQPHTLGNARPGTTPPGTVSSPSPEPPAAPASPAPARRGLAWWQAIPAGAAAATAVNLLVLLIGTAAGASFRLPDGDSVHEVTAGGVVFSSTVPLAVGTGLAVLLALWKPVFLRIGQIAPARWARPRSPARSPPTPTAAPRWPWP